MTAVRRRRIGRTLVSGIVTALALAATLPAAARESRQDRQIRLFERAVDQVLVDSPNFLVQSSEPTLGTYVEGRGAVFTFRTSLVDGEWNGHRWWKVWSSHDDREVIRDDRDDEDDGDYRSDRRDRSRERSLDRQEKKWRRGKQELVDLIADFGDVLTTVPDAESLVLEARLRRAELFRENDLRKLTLTVRMADVRAYAEGRLTESELETRITVKES